MEAFGRKIAKGMYEEDRGWVLGMWADYGIYLMGLGLPETEDKIGIEDVVMAVARSLQNLVTRTSMVDRMKELKEILGEYLGLFENSYMIITAKYMV